MVKNFLKKRLRMKHGSFIDLSGRNSKYWQHGIAKTKKHNKRNDSDWAGGLIFNFQKKI